MSLPFLQTYFGLSNSLQTAQASGGVGGWVELGRTTAGGASTTMTVSSIADKRYYMVLYLDKGMAGAPARVTTFNADTGSTYAWRYSFMGAADGTLVSTTNLNAWAVNDEEPQFAVQYISNLATKEKLMISHSVAQDAAGAGNAPPRGEFVGKWSNTANAISSLTVTCTSNFNSGDEVVVLGWDPADTHTNNFWTELASVETFSVGANIDSGVFTAKKYLWVQAYFKATGGTVAPWLRLGNTTIDTGSTYAWRHSGNGGADSTGITQTSSPVLQAAVSTPSFVNMFIINNSANEKLVFGSSISQSTAGAGTAPTRAEFAIKWANTSAQCNIVGFFDNGGTGDFATDCKIKVWGSN